jgi:hypothetical protein
MSYKTALRAKGIRPIPAHNRLRSYRGGGDDQHVIGPVYASKGIDFSKCRGDRFCRGRCCKPGRVSA